MEKVKAEEKYSDVIASGNSGFISNYDEELKSYSISIFQQSLRFRSMGKIIKRNYIR
jgi:hypothetical protein